MYCCRLSLKDWRQIFSLFYKRVECKYIVCRWYLKDWRQIFSLFIKELNVNILFVGNIWGIEWKCIVVCVCLKGWMEVYCCKLYLKGWMYVYCCSLYLKDWRQIFSLFIKELIINILFSVISEGLTSNFFAVSKRIECNYIVVCVCLKDWMEVYCCMLYLKDWM